MNSAQTKSVLRLLALIFVASFIGDKVVYFALNKLSDRVFTGQNIGKLNHFLSTKDSLDVIVFGSSRANHHIDPSLLAENSFNMGLDGRRLAYATALIKTLPAKKKQVVIINIDTKELFDPEYDGEDIRGLNCKYHRIQTIAEDLRLLNKSSPLQRVYWSIDYNGISLGIIKNCIKPNYDHNNYAGYDPLVLTDSQRRMRDMMFETATSEQSENDLVCNPISLRCLNDIKSFCTQNHKTLIAITTPRRIDTDKNDNTRMTEQMEELGIEYWDFSNYFDGDPNLDLWKDNVHLSRAGATLFSQHLQAKFANRIRSLGEKFDSTAD